MRPSHSLVLRTLQGRGPQTAAQLAEATGLSYSETCSALRKLGRLVKCTGSQPRVWSAAASPEVRNRMSSIFRLADSMKP